MAEAHQAYFPIFYLFNIGWDVLHMADFGKHPQNSLIGPPMERAVQGCGRARHGVVGVSITGGDVPHSRG